MSEQNSCPSCNVKMKWEAGLYLCEECDRKYQKVAYCPVCEAELEKLQACGATNYFCNSCNELKSKSRVRIEFQPRD